MFVYILLKDGVVQSYLNPPTKFHPYCLLLCQDEVKWAAIKPFTNICGT